MGMSASQARLLTLTNRLHDIEYKAQNIQAQKLALATQQDALYQEYCDALDAQNIMVDLYKLPLYPLSSRRQRLPLNCTSAADAS